MANKRKAHKRTIPVSIAIGTFTGIVLCVVISGVVAFLMCSGNLKEERGTIAALALLFTTSCVGCLTASKMAGEQIAVVSGVTAAAYTVILLGITLFLFDSNFSGLVGKLLAVLIGCVVACVLCAGKRRKKVTR